jgi:hypothetical protein
MNGFKVSRVLAFLSCISSAAFSSWMLADELSTDRSQIVQPSTAAVSVEEEPKRPLSSDATGSRGIKREIRELHEEVRVLRRDVNRLIELLQNQPTEAKTQVKPDPEEKGSSKNESKPNDEIFSNDSEPVSDEFLWERIGIRIKPVNVELDRYRGGLEILAVRLGSPAGQQGFRERDILVGLDKWETIERKNLDYVLRKSGLRNARTLKFYVIRGGETLFGHLTLPAIPSTDSASRTDLHTPLKVSDPGSQVVWDLTLNEAVHIALENLKVNPSLGISSAASDDSEIRIVASNLSSGRGTTETAIAIQNLVSDVEESYWKLWIAHHNLKSVREMAHSANVLWKIAFERYDKGIESSLAQAQTEQQYYFFRSALEQALQDLHQHERQLRHVLGLAQSDGRLIRATDEPKTTEAELDRDDVRANALANSPELIQQRRVVEQCELQLAAAHKEVPQALPGCCIAKRYTVCSPESSCSREESRTKGCEREGSIGRNETRHVASTLDCVT